MKLFAGLDVSLEKTAVCIEDDAGTIIWEKKVDSEPEALAEALAPWRSSIALVGLEACPLSEWIRREHARQLGQSSPSNPMVERICDYGQKRDPVADKIVAHCGSDRNPTGRDRY